MKIALKLRLKNGQVVVFTVHELLELAQSVTEMVYAEPNSERSMSGIWEGSHFNPQRLSTMPQWLMASKSLSQGASRQERQVIDQNKSIYQGEMWLKLLAYYDKKLDLELLNSQQSEATRPVWDFAADVIQSTIAEIRANYKVDKNLSNYQAALLGECDSKPTLMEPVKKKTKARQRGFYFYRLQGSAELRCLMVHHKKNTQDILVSGGELRKKVEEIEALAKNNDTRKLVEKICDTDLPRLTKAFLTAKGQQYYLSYADLQIYFAKVNAYLRELKFRFVIPTDNPFLTTFQQTYLDRIQHSADSDCLTHIRCIIGDIMTVPVLVQQYLSVLQVSLPETLELKDATEQLSYLYQHLPHVMDGEELEASDQLVTLAVAASALQSFCEKERKGLYADILPVARFAQHSALLTQLAGISESKGQVSDRELCYFLAKLRSAQHRGWTVETVAVEVEKNLDLIAVKSEKYRDDRLRHSAFYMLNKRIDLLKQYNVVRLLKNLGLPCLTRRDEENEAEYFVKKFQVIERVLCETGIISKKTSNQSKMVMSKMDISEYFSLLRLLCRSGDQMDADIKSRLLDILQKNKTKNIGCEGLCVTSNQLEWDYASSPLTYEEGTIKFFVIGDRVVGINHNETSKPLYVYDYGDTKATFASSYDQQNAFGKTVLNELHQIKSQHETVSLYINSVMTWYRGLAGKHPLNGTIKRLRETFEYANQKIRYVEYDQIKALLQSQAETFHEEKFRIQHIESILEYHVINGWLLDYELKLQRITPVSKLDKNTDIVTYPQITRLLVEFDSASEWVLYMRALLNGATAEVDTKHLPLVVLASAWFLAETGRNPMTMMSTLMMFDLIEVKVPYNSRADQKKYYTSENTVWDHRILDNTLSSDDRETQYPQQEGWGGKHPMCHGGSYARLFSKDRFPPIQDTLSQVRQKEGAILINWLSEKIRRLHPEIEVSTVRLSGKGKSEKTWSKKMPFFTYAVTRPANTDHVEKESILNTILKPLLEKRLANFDFLLDDVCCSDSESTSSASDAIDEVDFQGLLAADSSGDAVDMSDNLGIYLI